MRTIKIGKKEIGLKATPLALLFYRQEFDRDLVGDLMQMQDLADDPSKIDTVLLLQMAWAMAKAYEGVGQKFPGFLDWLAELESVDITEVITDITEEATDGFFRRGSKPTK